MNEQVHTVKSLDLDASRKKFAYKSVLNRELFEDMYENQDFLTQQIITYSKLI